MADGKLAGRGELFERVRPVLLRFREEMLRHKQGVIERVFNAGKADRASLAAFRSHEPSRILWS